MNGFETDVSDTGASIVNDTKIPDTISSSSSWPVIVGVAAGFSLMICAAFLIRKRRRLYQKAAKDLADSDSRSTDSHDSGYGVKMKAALVPLVGRKDRINKDDDNDDDDNVSEFSNAFPIPIRPLLPESDFHDQHDTDSLNGIADFPNVPFTTEPLEIPQNVNIGSRKSIIGGVFRNFVSGCDVTHCIQSAHDVENRPLFETVNEWETTGKRLLEKGDLMDDGVEDFDLDNTWNPDDADADTIDVQLSQKLLARYESDEAFLIVSPEDNEAIWDISDQ